MKIERAIVDGRSSLTVRHAIMVSALVGGMCLAVSGADAQDVRGQSVSERERPEYDPVGLRIGSFFVDSSMTFTAAYDDNIRASETGEINAFVTTYNPHIALSSNWSRHELNIEGDLLGYVVTDNGNENHLDGSGEMRGRLDIARDTNITGELFAARITEDRGSSNAVTVAREPTRLNRYGANAELNQRFNRVTASAAGRYTRLDFDDVDTFAGGIIDNDFRDREVIEGALRLGYDVSPGTNAFVEGTYNTRNYRAQPPAVAFTRDSDGYAVVAGAQFDITAITTGEIFAGYQDQDYDSALLPSASGPAYGAEVQWYATPITTVSFYAASTIEESTTPGSGGFVRQSVELAGEHELLRNVIASGAVAYRNEDYEGITRDDDYFILNVGADYLINQNFSAGFNYDFVDRDSNVTGLSYDRNVVGISIKGQI